MWNCNFVVQPRVPVLLSAQSLKAFTGLAWEQHLSELISWQQFREQRTLTWHGQFGKACFPTLLLGTYLWKFSNIVLKTSLGWRRLCIVYAKQSIGCFVLPNALMQRTTGKKYSQYRNKCTNEFRKIKSNYYNKQCCDMEREKYGSHRWWRAVKNVTGISSPSYPLPELHYGIIK